MDTNGDEMVIDTYDLTTAKTNGDISNGDIFRFSRPMRDHNTPTCTVRILRGLDGFCDGANLVDLEQQRIAGFEIDGFLDELRICNGKIVTREH